MSDLISREALLEDKSFSQCVESFNLEAYVKVEDLIKIIESQPTTYDVDIFIEQLEYLANKYDSPSTSDEWTRYGISIAINVLKAGGEE